MLRDVQGINVSNETIAGLTKREEDCESQVASFEVNKFSDAELVVSLVVDGVSLEAQAYIDPYRSNDGLMGKNDVLSMKTPSSRPLADLAGSSDLP